MLCETQPNKLFYSNSKKRHPTDKSYYRIVYFCGWNLFKVYSIFQKYILCFLKACLYFLSRKLGSLLTECMCLCVCPSVYRLSQKVLDRFCWNLAGWCKMTMGRFFSKMSLIGLLEWKLKRIRIYYTFSYNVPLIIFSDVTLLFYYWRGKMQLAS